MSERQAGYAPQDVAEDGVRVNVQVQATSDEIEDLVELVVSRLEGAGLVVKRKPWDDGKVELIFSPAKWLVDGSRV